MVGIGWQTEYGRVSLLFNVFQHVNSVSVKLQVGQSLFAGFGGKGLSNAEGSTLLVSDQQVPRISMS